MEQEGHHRIVGSGGRRALLCVQGEGERGGWGLGGSGWVRGARVCGGGGEGGGGGGGGGGVQGGLGGELRQGSAAFYEQKPHPRVTLGHQCVRNHVFQTTYGWSRTGHKGGLGDH